MYIRFYQIKLEKNQINIPINIPILQSQSYSTSVIPYNILPLHTYINHYIPIYLTGSTTNGCFEFLSKPS